ncbi:hypothetical protein [Marinobacter sp. F4206]|uniref:hypothetical protein n=1 Tax=Marinobacter sp. F4206 TaxID=2861777 RepID=UPI001C5D8D24|nr:hypothetical protein [Marinobacter sp. F4206]MBW4933785.1 hypothetical protein [Marinobacter sp. F4206]
MKTQWQTDLVNYFEKCLGSPELPGETPSEKRAASKVRTHLPRLQELANISSRTNFYKVLFSVSEQRVSNDAEIIFLHSAGGSGSHWVQDLLLKKGLVQPCGEVKFAKPVSSIVSRLKGTERDVALNAIHLLNLSDIDLNSLYIPIVNSSHMSGWKMSDLYRGKKRNVLLLRDPVDIVMSRTFRKNSYREFISPDSDDQEYLRKNVSFVKEFYRKAIGKTFDLVIKFEEISGHEDEVIENLKSILTRESARSFMCTDFRSRNFDNKYKGDRSVDNQFIVEAKNLLRQELSVFESTNSGFSVSFG